MESTTPESETFCCPITGSTERVLFAEQNGYSWYRFPASGVLRVALPHTLSQEVSFQEGHAANYIAIYERKLASKMRRSLGRARLLAARMRGRRLLDVGSNVGIFCAAARKIGLSPVGLEISRPLRDYAAARYPDLDFRDTPLESFTGEDRFDGIYCSEVIEHTLDPLAFARALHGLLTPGGALFVTTPAASEYLERGKPYRDLGAPDHKVYFDRDNFAAFLHAAGFRKVSLRLSLKPRRKKRTCGLFGGLQAFAQA
jgi:2-polyprenyl-3-methyl-5-hydroxy-6-metoxy-1,4-benzoquinol methylase